jgi:hypothetical protein
MFGATEGLCAASNIDNRATKYTWEIAEPEMGSGVRHDFETVTSGTPFTRVDEKLLDSVYLRDGSIVRCVAQAFGAGGVAGALTMSSENVVTNELEICRTKNRFATGAESFTSSIEYVEGASGNLMKIKVQMPHRDGMLPVISTNEIGSLESTLGAAHGAHQHPCSNLQLGQMLLQSEGGGESELSPLYNSLDVETCIWNFEQVYSMEQLVDVCGGSMNSDGYASGGGQQSFLSTVVPLHVAYVFSSGTAEEPWTALTQSVQLEFSFAYSTVAFSDGIDAIDGEFSGRLYPLKVIIRESDQRLQVELRTIAEFRGHFRTGGVKVLANPGDTRPVANLGFSLEMLQDASSFDEPEQRFVMLSDYAVQDYAGDYEIELIPCTVLPSQVFEDYVGDCTPREPITFVLPIEFQQTNQPVATEFTLAADYFLLHNVETFLDDPATSTTWPAEGAYNSAYSSDDVIFGRVSVDREQALGGSFKLKIRQVYLCTGSQGFVPRYQPSEGEFGCLQPTKRLQYRFKLYDLDDPTSVQKTFSGIEFDVKSADTHRDYARLSLQNDDDGFSFSASSLYGVVGGYQWFTQVVYRIESVDRKRRDDDGGIQSNEGTGLLPLKLAPRGTQTEETEEADEAENDVVDVSSLETKSSDEEEESEFPMFVAPLVVLGVFVIFAIFGISWINGQIKENKKRYTIYSETCEMPSFKGQEPTTISPDECEV